MRNTQSLFELSESKLVLLSGVLILAVAGICLFAMTDSDAAVPLPNQSTMTFTGQSDASAAVAVDEGRFLIADDEDNVLRVYSLDQPTKPITEFDLSEFLGIQKKKKSKEADLEGACRIGNRIYFISSHGLNRKGKAAPDRQRFFAVDMEISKESVNFHPVGKPYTGLTGRFVTDAAFAPYDLRAAAERAPKTEAGLNLEGLCATPEGNLLLGFRSPVPGGRALIVPLKNPDGVIADGEEPVFGHPMTLDLGGLGIRSLDYWKGVYYMIAGPHSSEGPFRLYTWMGGGTRARWVKSADFSGLNPEAFIFPQGTSADRFFVVSDDGGEMVIVGGKKMQAKKIKDQTRKQFRVMAVKHRGRF